ncbi:hypothetical protein AB6A40_010865 [Gnathostoma spinigerum]|uniref:Large ribosomal subunit protein bL21m n=1 Tax=Gnathostoma spinigerum TaxID=75299 RepID=A0ABD6EW92_9BILA
MAMRSCFALAMRRMLSVASCSSPPTAEIISSSKVEKIVSKIAEEVVDSTNRLFAVVYMNGRQFKVTQGDLISLLDNVPLDVGDRIKLEKQVLLVGGKNFTLIGRPLLPSSAVMVSATVVEKSTTYPELKYVKVDHKSIRKVLWLSQELTVLRINNISVAEDKFSTQK